MDNMQTYELRHHLGDKWKDRAGHDWQLRPDGTFTSKHGTARIHQWKTVENGRETWELDQ